MIKKYTNTVKSLFMGDRPLFVAFMDNPCPWIYIPMNIYTSICLLFIKIIPNLIWIKLPPHKPEKFWLYPWTLTPMNKNESTVYKISSRNFRWRIYHNLYNSFLHNHVLDKRLTVLWNAVTDLYTSKRIIDNNTLGGSRLPLYVKSMSIIW